ncbi:MAG: type III secretion system export apparatus subunit SctR [Myxococcaceae bacterium]|nr:type III secretion system export apparatus subunit SctR [Myxococcaceae bacterium]MBH2005931.1 type III secretion system export apparatus subunit SctR [Myxococcaceae bacterium]
MRSCIWKSLTLTIGFSQNLWAQSIHLNEVSSLASGAGIASKPLLLMMGLVALSLLPFVGMMVTSFVKMAVVLSITRQAIGMQQAPPNTVITGLSILLTVYVMHPVGLDVYRKSERYMNYRSSEFFDKANVDMLLKAVQVSEEPIKHFLKTQASEKNLQMFYRIAQKIRKAEDRPSLSMNDYIILVPAFVITELTKAFQIGFMIFLPFMVIDMAVSNILMALGMQMLAPTMISLPFKLLLFVMVDGWHLISKGLVLGYPL